MVNTGDKCGVCKIGHILPSLYCDHCNTYLGEPSTHKVRTQEEAPSDNAQAVLQKTLHYRSLAVNDMLRERRNQDDKWGQQDHEMAVWLEILHEETGELAEADLHHRFGGPKRGNVFQEAVQVAAVALKIVEYLRRGIGPHDNSVGRGLSHLTHLLSQTSPSDEKIAKEAVADCIDCYARFKERFDEPRMLRIILAVIRETKAVAPSVVAGVEEKECQVSPISSRVCERGTKGCEVDHLTLEEPRGELAATHVLQNALKECPWPEDVWLTNVKDAGDAMRALHLTDAAITSISGTLMRHGWQCAEKKIQEILSSHGVGEHATGVSSNEEIAREVAEACLSLDEPDDEWLITATKVILTAIRKAKSLSELDIIYDQRESKAILDLCERQGLSRKQLLRQALREYQIKVLGPADLGPKLSTSLSEPKELEEEKHD